MYMHLLKLQIIEQKLLDEFWWFVCKEGHASLQILCCTGTVGGDGVGFLNINISIIINMNFS